jgi:hypothetical protein
VQDLPEEVTLDGLAIKLDVLGQQMNWLCENLTSLFAFVNQMGSSGGGIRGLMHMLKQGPPPDLNTGMPVDTETKVGA